MSNIVIRTITGAIFTGMIVASIIFGIYSSTAVLGLFVALGLFEFANLFQREKYIKLNRWPLVILGTLIFVLGSITVLYPDYVSLFFNASIFSLLVLALSEIWRKKKSPFLNVAVAILGLIYIVVPMLLVNRLVEVEMSDFPVVIGMFVLIWTNDTFAYLSGRFFGKTKLIERISPKKTWEGTIGGFIMTIVFAIAIGYFTDRYLFWIVAGVLMSPAAILGDLFESLIKRSLRIKDSGSILPGHGGILDRFDATFVAGPVFGAWVNIYFLLQA